MNAALKDSEIDVRMLHLSVNKDEEEESYYRNFVSQLQVQIKNTDRLIFHFNNIRNDKLVKLLRETFDCRIITTVHCFKWGFYIFDNLSLLRNIMNGKRSDNFVENIKKTVEEEKSLFSMADNIVCLSNYMHGILCRDYGFLSTKITVIPNGLSDKYNSTTDTQLLREKWKIPANERIILFAGRVDAIKGLEYLAKSFIKVLSAYPKSRLVIAGEGAFGHFIKESQNICTHITYTGFLDKLQLYEWYQIAEIGVIPSLFESFGYVAVEMMMHELPVVVTATSGLNEVVDESCGIKIPLTIKSDKVEIDTDLLAEKILYLLQHPVEAKKMGQNGRKRYLKEYSSEVFRKNMIKFYNSLYT